MPRDLASGLAGDAEPGSNEEVVEGGECPFCQIVNGRTKAEIVYSDAQAIAFLDAHPQAPHHVLVVPRCHIAGLDRLVAESGGGQEGLEQRRPSPEKVGGHLLWVAARVAQQLGLDKEGYRVVVNTGAGAGQTIRHLHLHVLGGRVMRWPPG